MYVLNTFQFILFKQLKNNGIYDKNIKESHVSMHINLILNISVKP